MKILNVRWFSGKDCVGAVLVLSSDGKKRVYLGVASSDDEEMDARSIAEFGVRLSYPIAAAMFNVSEKDYGHQGI